MPSVSVMINGKAYRMACDEGQEPHLLMLGERLNEAIDELRSSFGEIGDQRLIVMAAITMADQAAEAKRRLDRLEVELQTLRSAVADGPQRERAAEADLVQAVSGAADRIADIARRLNASK